MEVAENKLKLDGDAGTTYKFDRVRFVVQSGAILRVDVPVEFTGDRTQVLYESSAAVCVHRLMPAAVSVHSAVGTINLQRIRQRRNVGAFITALVLSPWSAKRAVFFE